MTRRNFIHLGLVATGMAAVCPRRTVWSAIAGAGSLRFVFCADVHAAARPPIATALDRAAASIRAHHADFVIVGGDLICGGYTSSVQAANQHWDVYMRFHEQLGTKVRPVLGNHDLVAVAPADGSRPEADPRQVFRDRLGLDRTWYSFDAAGYHFMVLDSVRVTTDEFRYHGYISPEQREWIEQDLAGYPRQTPIILMTHLPLWTRFFETYDVELEPSPPHRVVTNSAQVLNLFADRNLVLVLQGHLHFEETLLRDTTRFTTGGAICGNWWHGDRHGTGPGYGLVTLSGQHVSWEYCEYAWED